MSIFTFYYVEKVLHHKTQNRILKNQENFPISQNPLFEQTDPTQGYLPQ